MMYGYYGHGLAGGMLGFGFMIIFWILIAVLIAAVIRFAMGKSRWHREEGSDRAMDILRERYAKGEINKEEFESRKKDLKPGS